VTAKTLTGRNLRPDLVVHGTGSSHALPSIFYLEVFRKLSRNSTISASHLRNSESAQTSDCPRSDCSALLEAGIWSEAGRWTGALGHRATLLANGKVLITGLLENRKIYDPPPASSDWSAQWCTNTAYIRPLTIE